MAGGLTIGAVPDDVAGEVERTDDGFVFLVAPVVGRDEPHHLELDAVGVLGIQALVDAVIGRAVQRTGGGEPDAVGLEFGERRDLPREVVQADLLTARRRVTRGVADREAGEVVVVGRRRRPQEHERSVGIVDDGLEAEHVFVEVLLAARIAHVQHGVVHPGDHRAAPTAFVVSLVISVVIVLSSSGARFRSDGQTIIDGNDERQENSGDLRRVDR